MNADRAERRAMLRVLGTLERLTTAIPNADAQDGAEARGLIAALDACALAVEEFAHGIPQRYGQSMTVADAAERWRYALDYWSAKVKVGSGGADYIGDDAPASRTGDLS